MSRLDPAARKKLESLQKPGAPSFYKQLVGIFYESSEGFLKVLADPATDAKTLNRTAHSWKGIAQGMGASVLSDLCLKLELISNDQSVNKAPVIEAIREEYALVKAELEAEP